MAPADEVRVEKTEEEELDAFTELLSEEHLFSEQSEGDEQSHQLPALQLSPTPTPETATSFSQHTENNQETEAPGATTTKSNLVEGTAKYIEPTEHGSNDPSLLENQKLATGSETKEDSKEQVNKTLEADKPKSEAHEGREEDNVPPANTTQPYTSGHNDQQPPTKKLPEEGQELSAAENTEDITVQTSADTHTDQDPLPDSSSGKEETEQLSADEPSPSRLIRHGTAPIRTASSPNQLLEKIKEKQALEKTKPQLQLGADTAKPGEPEGKGDQGVIPPSEETPGETSGETLESAGRSESEPEEKKDAMEQVRSVREQESGG